MSDPPLSTVHKASTCETVGAERRSERRGSYNAMFFVTVGAVNVSPIEKTMQLLDGLIAKITKEGLPLILHLFRDSKTVKTPLTYEEKWHPISNFDNSGNVNSDCFI